MYTGLIKLQYTNIALGPPQPTICSPLSVPF